MTTEQKNIAIAEMLGWTWSKEKDGKTYMKKTPKTKDIYSLRPKLLCFDRDANWQFEAIDYIAKKHYELDLKSLVYGKEGYGSGNCRHYCWFHKTDEEGQKTHSIGYNGKDKENRNIVIFEALYQFSQYIQQIK